MKIVIAASKDRLVEELSRHTFTTSFELLNCACGWYVKRGPGAHQAATEHLADSILESGAVRLFTGSSEMGGSDGPDKN